MPFCLLLAAQFLLMSDRASFWDPDKIAGHTKIARESTESAVALTSQDIRDKNILLLVHGYNNNAMETLSTYRLINANLSGLMSNQRANSYDYIIGYLWPGYEETLEYFKAKHHVPRLAKKVRSHLEFLSASAEKLDVLAHSMGNFLMLEALDYSPAQEKKLVRNYFALAPAVDNEVLERKEKYYPSTQNCEGLFVFYSKGDDVLKWSYSVAEWDRALGYEGAEHPARLPDNVHLIDYSGFIGGHSEYFTFLPMYEFIRSRTLPASRSKN
jgi:esterase/lipase superfamily enzyme